MQNILKEFEKNNHISLVRGNGRGNQSELKINYSKLQVAKMYVNLLQESGKTSAVFDFIKGEQLMSNNDFQLWFHSNFLQSGSAKNQRVLRFSLPDTNLNISPVYGISRHDSHFTSLVHDTLFKFDSDFEVYTMNLVLHFEMIEPHTWIFYLKPDAKFHNDKNVTSKDVEWSLGSSVKKEVNILKDYSFKVIDENIFIIKAKDSIEYIKAVLSFTRFSIMPEKTDSHWIGCGPYKISEMNKRKIHFQKFNQYHSDKPWLDELEGFYNEDERFHTIVKYPKKNIPLYRKITVHPPGFKYLLFNTYRLSYTERILIKQNIDFSQLVNSDEHLISKNKQRIQRSDTSRSLNIGVQAIRENADYFKEAVELKKQLEDAGYNCSITKLYIQDEDDIADVDIFIGGVFLLENKIFQSLIFFNHLEKRFKEMLSIDITELTSKRPVEGEMENFVIEMFIELENQCVLSRIATRKYHYYYMPNKHLKNIEIKMTGLIDFKNLILAGS